jgi:hypothetical protein
VSRRSFVLILETEDKDVGRLPRNAEEACAALQDILADVTKHSAELPWTVRAVRPAPPEPVRPPPLTARVSTWGRTS